MLEAPVATDSEPGVAVIVNRGGGRSCTHKRDPLALLT